MNVKIGNWELNLEIKNFEELLFKDGKFKNK